MDYDQGRIAEDYDAGRTYDPATLEQWVDHVARACASPVRRALDLGCGTGRYSHALAQRLGCEMIGVDPSERMLERARAKGFADVEFIRAGATSLPFPQWHFDLVFLSMVLHHLDDQPRAIAEIRRVLGDSGKVCLRAATRERLDSLAFLAFFDGAREIAEADVQPEGEIRQAFAEAGFSLVSHEVVSSQVASSWEEYCRRIRCRSDSVLVRLGDERFEEGVERLAAHARQWGTAEPICEQIDFFCFAKWPE